MMSTETLQHDWIKMTMTPVMTLSDGEGEPVVFVDPEQMIIAEDNSVYGCNRCGKPMTGNYNTTCEGAEED